MNEPIGKAKNLVSQVQKGIVKLNMGFRGAAGFEKDIANVFGSIDELKHLAGDKDKVDEYVRGYVSEEALIAAYKEMKENYYNVKQILDRFQDVVESSDIFFEKYRDYRYYDLKEDDDYYEFVDRVCRHLNISDLLAKPEMLGSINFDDIIKKLKLSQESGMYVKVPLTHLKPFFEEVLAKNPNVGVRFEAHNITFVWRPSNYVRIDVKPDLIPQIDNIAKGLNAQVMPI
ncbi:MAG: hypothetical protein JXA43_03300 [Candidatus Diapherotrites archaeon]|nr:hypothetical protein [Candidatus Diapherotrites archaeon]